MNYISLAGHYKSTLEFTNTKYDHPMSISDIENLYPFERDIHTTLLIEYLEAEKERANNNG